MSHKSLNLHLNGRLLRALGPLQAGLVALALSACAEARLAVSPASTSLPERGPATSESASQTRASAALAPAHKANPSDPAAALAYARALRAEGAKAEALAVLDKAAAATKPTDRRLQLERGLLALDLGQPAKAETLLREAHDAKAPDWRLHSALGAALAARGKQPEAQQQFAKALVLAPDNQTVLNNLALSYALDGKAEEAEKLLRKLQRSAAKSPQVEQNLALVLGLRGKYEEARTVAETAMPAPTAKENVDYLQKLSSAREAAPAAKGEPVASAEARKASASLPPPSYQLGGPPRAGE